MKPTKPLNALRGLMPTALTVACFSSLLLSTSAQAAAAAYTTHYRYDAGGRLVGVIKPDPDGSGPLKFAAVRNTYEQSLLVKVETGELATWQDETVAPASWVGFSVFQSKDSAYDNSGRKLIDRLTSAGEVYALTQTSYDSLGRVDCVAVRMNLAVSYSSLPNACTLSTAGSYGSDRITKNTYDATTHVLKVQKALGTPLQQDYATYTYNANGQQTSATDANKNFTRFGFDGLDRQDAMYFPSKTSINTASTTDFEQYTYDNNGNRTSLKKRDGNIINYNYDSLNRVLSESYQGGTVQNVFYDYDLRNLQLYARFGSGAGTGITATYDGFGRLMTASTNQSGTARTLSYLYDAEGNRTRVTHPDGVFFSYALDGLNRLTTISENGTTTVASISYDNQGRRQTLNRGANVTTTAYGYDPVSRLQTLTQNLDGATTTNDETRSFTYSPASQMLSRNLSNAVYSFTQVSNAGVTYSVNGLNQYTQIVGAAVVAPRYDANGNMTSDGATTYRYDVLNRLTAATGGHTVNLSYDPKGRLYQTSGGASGTTQFLYDGDALVGEYNGSGALLRRYVHGPNVDEPLVWYEGATVSATTRRYLHADHQGSVIAAANSAGTTLQTNSYDPYGVPATTNSTRFQYTGQIALADLGLYYYKARIYNPTLGRFMQTDPIGYKDDLDLYTYVGNDPMDRTDPTGNSFLDVGFLAYDAVKFGVAVYSGVGVGAAGADLAISMVGMVSPVPGTGQFIKGLRTAEHVAKEVSGASKAAKAFSKEKQALVEMAKADKKAGMTSADMKAYKELNKDLKDPFPSNKVRGPESHPSAGAVSSQEPHGHVGPVDHIPIKDPKP